MNDRALLARVAAAFDRYDPVPGATVAAAMAAGRLVARRPNRLVPVVSGDSRGPVAGPVLSFVAPAGRVAVTLAIGPQWTIRLTGVVAGDGALVVRWPAGERIVAVDDVGRFAAAGLPRGPLGVALRWPGAEFVSPWFVA